MQAEVQHALLHYLKHDASILWITMNKDGLILSSNTFADTLTGKSLEGCNVTDMFIRFDRPFSITEQLARPDERVLINISTASEIPETYYFRFYEVGDTVLAIGEADSGEIGLLRTNLLELNKELHAITRELHKKNAELRKLDELKNKFLGIAAHDLRNPLGIIMAYSDFLLEDLDGALDEDQVKMLHSIRSSSQFMLRLLNDLLDISAIESGKLKLSLVKADPIPVITRHLELQSVLAAKKGISVLFECFEHIPAVLFDPDKIEQVLSNLISNAVKFSVPGTTVKVSVFLSGNHCTVAVADQGPGIPPSEVDGLFMPFQKTSVKSTAGEKSTGLGLSIVRNIVLGHHGKIWVESTVGSGTTFYFTLPLDGSSAKTDSNPAHPDDGYCADASNHDSIG